MWVRQAKALMLEGDSRTAKQILHRALRHARSNEDHAMEGMSLHLLARLAGLEGNLAQGIALEREAQQHTNVFEFWRDSSEHLAELMAEESLTSYGAHTFDDALGVLTTCNETMGRVLANRPNLRNEIAPLRASLVLKGAAMTLQNSIRQDEGGSIIWRKEHESQKQAARDACVELASLGGGPQYVHGLLLR